MPPGEVPVTITVPAQETALGATPEDQPLTDEEIDALLRPNPKTGAEIVALGHTGGWEHKGIADSQAWVEELRRK